MGVERYYIFGEIILYNSDIDMDQLVEELNTIDYDGDKFTNASLVGNKLFLSTKSGYAGILADEEYLDEFVEVLSEAIGKSNRADIYIVDNSTREEKGIIVEHGAAVIVKPEVFSKPSLAFDFLPKSAELFMGLEKEYVDELKEEIDAIESGRVAEGIVHNLIK